MSPVVLNKYKLKPEDTGVYCGRGSPWGNPFAMDEDLGRNTVCDMFEEYANITPGYKESVKAELAGKNLICFCKPMRCHCDTLLRIANDLPKTPINVNLLQALPLDTPFLLVTAGGGGDGEFMIDTVLRAYEHDPSLTHPCLIIFGPFMQPGAVEGWSIEGQRDLFNMLGGQQLDLKINDAHFLIPYISDSAVIGLGAEYSSKNIGSLCESCPRFSSCMWRRENIKTKN